MRPSTQPGRTKRTNRLSLEMAGAMVGRFTPGYRLVRSLGAGTYGQVFLIEDDLKQLAVKIIPLEFRKAATGGPNVGLDWARLKTSFNLLHHPALVRVRDFFRYEDTDPDAPVRAYGLVYMDYWPSNLGRLVRTLKTEARLTTAHQFALLIRLAELLQRLKVDCNLLVTDLKLGNVMVREGGEANGTGGVESLTLGIVDLGGLNRIGAASLRRVESTGYYWAPELHEDAQEEIDEVALIYSFGLIGFFVLEGREAFQKDAGNDDSPYREIREEGGPDWSAVTSSETLALRQIVDRCLADRRAQRYSTFAEIAAALDAARRLWLAGPPAAISPGSSEWCEPLTGMSFVRIAGGTFNMGASEDEHRLLKAAYSPAQYARWFAHELPLHEVELNGFWMACTPVTRGQFARCVAETLYLTDAEREGWSFGVQDGAWGEQAGLNWRNPGFAQEDDHPVVCVSWFDAMEFVRWLSLRAGAAFSLPSEAQWEYACRAGSATPFHFGGAITPEHANYDARKVYDGGRAGLYRAATTPVGRFPANSSGLRDMHGNVWEWCADRLDDSFYTQTEARQADPLCQRETGVRVRRGGSWSNAPTFLRSAYRGRNYPDHRYVDIGFRLAMASRA